MPDNTVAVRPIIHPACVETAISCQGLYETRIYDEDLKITHVVQPAVGKALVFEHAIVHEGVAVDEGSKYVLRTDVMYGPGPRAVLD